jgi:hypothetical protein
MPNHADYCAFLRTLPQRSSRNSPNEALQKLPVLAQEGMLINRLPAFVSPAPPTIATASLVVIHNEPP